MKSLSQCLAFNTSWNSVWIFCFFSQVTTSVWALFGRMTIFSVKPVECVG